MAQCITWFISGRRKSLPAGVKGSSVSFPGEPIRKRSVCVWPASERESWVWDKKDRLSGYVFTGGHLEYF